MTVALTGITYGSKGARRPDGTIAEEEPAKRIQAGEKVNKADFSTEEWNQLVDSGAVGEEDDLAAAPILGSTASILQREDSVSLTNVPPAATGSGAAPTDDETVAEALADATDQVARQEEDGTNAAKDSKKAASK